MTGPLGLIRGFLAGIKHVFRLILTAKLPSSTNFTDFDSDLEIGPRVFLGIGGLRKAPLYLTIKIIPPKCAPCGPPPGSCFSAEQASLYFKIIDLLDR